MKGGRIPSRYSADPVESLSQKERAVIDHREAQYSAATGSRQFLIPRMVEARLDVGIANTRGRPVDHFMASPGQRWKASMMRVPIPPPYAAMSMMRAVWLTTVRSRMRSVRVNSQRLAQEWLRGRKYNE